MPMSNAGRGPHRKRKQAGVMFYPGWYDEISEDGGKARLHRKARRTGKQQVRREINAELAELGIR